NMHGVVPGASYAVSMWIYIPTASGVLPSEVTCNAADALSGEGFFELDNVAATTLDAWQEITFDYTVRAGANGYADSLVIATGAAQNEYIYVDDIRLIAHNVPGSHYLSGGFIETLLPMPDKFTI
ncbi:hypothetical protein LCGC14_2484980, partial [marine sediment metagenome]